MNQPAELGDDFRARIIADPDVILADPDLMRALIAANDQTIGDNVVDLRGLAMERLEERLDRLESTHRSVIAAAYENLAGTNTVHRAVLRLLEPTDFSAFLRLLSDELADILRVDCLRLVLETLHAQDDPALHQLGEAVIAVAPGFITAYLTGEQDLKPRRVTLRALARGDGAIHGTAALRIRSEACLRLELGPGRLPALLVLGAADPQQFRPAHGTDLLAFFADVVERVLRRWLD